MNVTNLRQQFYCTQFCINCTKIHERHNPRAILSKNYLNTLIANHPNGFLFARYSDSFSYNNLKLSQAIMRRQTIAQSLVCRGFHRHFPWTLQSSSCFHAKC